MHTEFAQQSKKDNLFQQSRNLLRVYLLPQWRRALILAVMLLVGIALRLVNPQVLRYFLDQAQAGSPTQTLMLAAAAFIAFALLEHLVTLIANYFSQTVSWTATNHLRTDLALHCLRLDMPFHKRRTPGELIERIDGDVTQLANFFSQFLVKVTGNILLVLGILLLLYLENWAVGVGMTVYTALTLFVLGVIQRMAIPRWKEARQISSEQYGYLEERISGVEEIQTCGAEEYALRRLGVMMKVFLEKNRAAFVVSSLAHNLTNLIYAIGYAVGLAFGVTLFLRGEVSLGTAFLITYYVGMLAEPLQSIRHQTQDMQQASACIQRVQEILDDQPEVRDTGNGELPSGPLPVAFRNVSFHYDNNEDVLRDVTFSVEAGRVLGILGRTGSGKSTLTRLLFRLYDPSHGAVMVGDTPLAAVPLSHLRQRVGMVTQDVQLFQASLRDNLTFFNADISDERLEQVLRDLRLWDWVLSQNHGLDTLLSAGGQGLSAGEAQLLAFARVFLKDPGLVILDEASSRLDPATENLMERAINRLFADRTGILIAHRLKTVQRADDILILEEGQVVEYGSRAALASDPNSRFYHLLQTGLEEVLA